MKKEIISQLHSSFELAVNETDGIEYWFARDLQELLGYTKWENFIKVIDKGKIACSNAKQETSDHFLDVRKMVDLGSAITSLFSKFSESDAPELTYKWFGKMTFEYKEDTLAGQEGQFSTLFVDDLAHTMQFIVRFCQNI